MKTIITIVLLAFLSGAYAQKCPVPKTKDQSSYSFMSGKWEGEYDLQGEKKKLIVVFSFNKENLTATIKDVNGRIEGVSCRICPNDELHIKGEAANSYVYEFAGIPDGKSFKGRITLRDEKDKMLKQGSFKITKSG